MIIICDIDNTINNLLSRSLEIYNIRNNKNIKLSDITTYSFYECLPQEDADGIISLFKEKELWDSLKPLPGSQKALKTLVNNGHKVYLATATLPENFLWKVQWVEKYFPFINTDNIIRIMDKSLLHTDVLIEDNIDNLTNNFCDRICLDYLYNRDPSKDFAYDINRIHSWDEIINIINKIERRNQE